MIDFEDLKQPADEYGERYIRLWERSLLRAVLDSHGLATDVHIGERRDRIARQTDKWFWSESRLPGSFLFHCEILDISPDMIRMNYKTRGYREYARTRYEQNLRSDTFVAKRAIENDRLSAGTELQW